MSNKVKNILLLSSWFATKGKPFLGNFIHQQAELLAQSVDVYFVRLIPNGQVGTKEHSSVHMIDVYYKKSRFFLFTFLNKKKALSQALSQLPKIDVIHAHVSSPDGWLFKIAKKQLNVPLVLTEHGSYFREEVHWSAKMNWTIRQGLLAADSVVAVSEVLAKSIQKRFPNKKVAVIPNSIDTTLFKIADYPPIKSRFIHVSTLDKIKKPQPILEAFARIEKEFSEVELGIVSDEDYTFLKNKAQKLRLKNCSFKGPLLPNQIVQELQQSSCFVLNSDYESFSVVIAEAWACGLPVISTNVGIATDLSSQYGIQTNGTVDSIENAMRYFIENKSSFNQQIIREKALNFSNEKILQTLLLKYSSLIK